MISAIIAAYNLWASGYFQRIFITRKIDKLHKDFWSTLRPPVPKYSDIPKLCIAYKMNQKILGPKLLNLTKASYVPKYSKKTQFIYCRHVLKAFYYLPALSVKISSIPFSHLVECHALGINSLLLSFCALRFSNLLCHTKSLT